MLTVTHLGHSGWICESEGRTILVDPLLQADFGRGARAARMPCLWPPRLLSMANFPTLDAVVISHEHEDHFNLPSLAMIDRSIPVYMPNRSSVAATSILREMGFNCHPLVPSEPIRFGSLELLPLAPDFVTSSHVDEWDVLALVFRNIDRGGTFFTTVDVPINVEMIRQLRTSGLDQWMLFHTMGVMSWKNLQDIGIADAQGYSTVSQNKTVDCEARASGKPWKPCPGESVSVSDSQILSCRADSSFLHTPPRSAWGDPASWRHHPRNSNYNPACGKADLSKSDLQILNTGLLELAQYMYGGSIFRALFSLTGLPAELKLSFLLLLITGRDKQYYALEYSPTSCSFESACPEHPLKEYVCGVECWATDLVALFRGDFEPRILSLGHSRHWSYASVMPDPFMELIWPFFHPLRRPSECLRRYRQQFQALSSTPIVIAKNTLVSDTDGSASGGASMIA